MTQQYCYLVLSCPHCRGLTIDKLDWSGEQMVLTRFCAEDGHLVPTALRVEMDSLAISNEGFFIRNREEQTLIAGPPKAILPNEESALVAAKQIDLATWDKRYGSFTVEMLELMSQVDQITVNIR